MSASLLAGVAVLGGFGAVFRFVLDGAVTSRAGSAFPSGTYAVNVLGALILGIFVGAGASGDLLRLLALGALGGFTTFSTWVFETHRLAEDGMLRVAALNIGLSLAFGIAAVWLGKLIGGAM